MLFCFKLVITIKRASRLVGSIAMKVCSLGTVPDRVNKCLIEIMATILAEAYGHFLQGCRATLDEKAALNVFPRRELKDCLTKLKPEEV